MRKIRILLVDDHALVRESLRAVLDRQPDMEVVGEAGDGTTAVQMALEQKPDIVLMDIRMPNGDGVEATRVIRSRCPGTQVIAVTIYRYEKQALQVLKAGARGYVLKHSSGQKLINAIRKVYQGEVSIDEGIMDELLAELGRLSDMEAARPWRTLTKREIDILKLVAQGLKNREIAAQLSLSEHTIKNRLSTIYQKLQVHTRIEAAEALFSLAPKRIGQISIEPDEEVTRDSGLTSDVALLIGSLVHRLSNLIGPIPSTVQRIVERDLDSNELAQTARDIAEAAENALAILRRLRTLSTPLGIEPLDVNELLLTALRGCHVPDSIKVDLELSDSIPLVAGNLQIGEAFVNLISNAIEAMPNGGVLYIRSQEVGGGCVEVIIADTGCGMSKEIQGKIFSPFFSTKREKGGQGLGLYLSKMLIERFGGSISLVESTVGKGTTFLIKLPIAKVAGGQHDGCQGSKNPRSR